MTQEHQINPFSFRGPPPRIPRHIDNKGIAQAIIGRFRDSLQDGVDPVDHLGDIAAAIYYMESKQPTRNADLIKDACEKIVQDRHGSNELQMLATWAKNLLQH